MTRREFLAIFYMHADKVNYKTAQRMVLRSIEIAKKDNNQTWLSKLNDKVSPEVMREVLSLSPEEIDKFTREYQEKRAIMN